MQNANEQYGGDSFPEPPARLLRGSGIELPNIAGLGVDEATFLLESLGLKLEVTAGAPSGNVSLFEPAAGTLLARGMTVRVTTGGGASGAENREYRIMPDIVGLSRLQADATLNLLGMTGFRDYSCGPGSISDDSGDGIVTSQSRDAGSQVGTFMAIQIKVACGVAPATGEETVLD
jgi:beta-lactam-binding protein with PASTA domain